MRRFEAIVMQEREPETEGTLWLKPKKNTLNSDGPTQYEIWYFSEKGWTPMSDFDTRYIMKDAEVWTKETGDDNLIFTTKADIENGIVSITPSYNIYDGSRDLGDNTNFVNEKGLNEIYKSINTRIASIEKNLANLSSSLTTLIANYNVLSDKVSEHEKFISGSGGSH